MSPRCSVCGKSMIQWTETEDGRKFCSDACYESTLPRCSVCGKPMKQWTETKDGKKFCSDACYTSALPRCSVCGKPMQQWTETKDGKKFCSDACYSSTLPRCSVCGKPMQQWTETEDGKKFCSDACYESILPRCAVCGKPIQKGFHDRSGKHYCSEACFEKTLPKCAVCGKPMQRWTETEDGKKFCSDTCYESILPRCAVCGKPMKQWTETKDGKKFCSDTCYESTLPRCSTCGKHMKNWIETSDGHKFCNQSCLDHAQKTRSGQPKVDMSGTLTAQELAYLTGLEKDDCEKFMSVNSINGDQALEAIDIFMQSLNEHVTVPFEIAACLKNAGIYSKLASRLSSYNTMRGGTKGYGGFVFEELHAADAASKGVSIDVLNNNGPADFIVVDANGHETLLQAKAGYKANQIDWSKYKGQKIIVDRGNSVLANDARAAGLQVEESAIYKSQADCLARAQQWESKLTGSSTAPFTATAASAHYAGLASAKLAARVGLSLNMGATIYDLVSGDKSFDEAASDFIADGIMITGSAYLSGAALSIAGTAVSAVAGTATGMAVSSAVAGAAATVSSTAIGGAVMAGIGSAAASIGAAVASVASAPLIPFVLGGAAIGFLGKCFRKKF